MLIQLTPFVGVSSFFFFLGFYADKLEKFVPAAESDRSDEILLVHGGGGDRRNRRLLPLFQLYLRKRLQEQL